MPKFRCFLCLNFKRKELKNYEVPAAIDPPVSHRFPARKDIRSMWTKICRLDEKIDNTSGLVICSKHFFEDDYVDVNARKFGGIIRLKPTAVPKLLIPHGACEPEIYENVNAKDGLLEDKFETAPIKFLDPIIIKSEVTVKSEYSHPVEKGCKKSPVFYERCETPTKRQFTTPSYIGDLSSAHVSTPRRARRTLQFVKNSIHHKNLQIKTLRQKNRRLLKKMQCLQDLIKHQTK